MTWVSWIVGKVKQVLPPHLHHRVTPALLTELVEHMPFPPPHSPSKEHSPKCGAIFGLILAVIRNEPRTPARRAGVVSRTRGLCAGPRVLTITWYSVWGSTQIKLWATRAEIWSPSCQRRSPNPLSYLSAEMDRAATAQRDTEQRHLLIGAEAVVSRGTDAMSLSPLILTFSWYVGVLFSIFLTTSVLKLFL
jgi:hypothetical protein